MLAHNTLRHRPAAVDALAPRASCGLRSAICNPSRKAFGCRRDGSSQHYLTGAQAQTARVTVRLSVSVGPWSQ